MYQSLVVLFGLILISLGCGSKEAFSVLPFNTHFDGGDQFEGVIKLESLGWVGVQQSFKGKGLTCETVGQIVHVKLSHLKSKQPIQLERLCLDKNDSLVFRSVAPLQPEEYQLSVIVRERHPELLNQP